MKNLHFLTLIINGRVVPVYAKKKYMYISRSVFPLEFIFEFWIFFSKLFPLRLIYFMLYLKIKPHIKTEYLQVW